MTLTETRFYRKQAVAKRFTGEKRSGIKAAMMGVIACQVGTGSADGEGQQFAAAGAA